MTLKVLCICRSWRLDMGLEMVSRVRRYQGQCQALRPWGIKAGGFAVKRKIRHHTAVTW